MNNYYSNDLYKPISTMKYAIDGDNITPMHSKTEATPSGCRAISPPQSQLPIMSPIVPPGEQTPITLQSKDYVAGFLKGQIGKRMKVEFLLGSGPLVDQTGELISVGASYILLYSESTGDTIMCDLYSIKFVTIYGQRVIGT